MIKKIKTSLELKAVFETANFIKIYLKNGQEIKGKTYAYTSAINNTPEIPEIDIEDEKGNISAWYLDEIESIEIISQ